MESILAERTKLIDASGIRKVFALAATLKDPVNFSIGQPDFDVPDAVKKAAIQAIERGFNRYSQTAGDEGLVARITAEAKARFPWDPKVIITSGVSGGLLLAFMSMINPGDEVIIPDPYFVMYKHLARMFGGTCVYIDTYPDFGLPVQKIAAAITDRTKLIVLNSPVNPTGAVFTAKEIADLAEVASRRQIAIISDEIYEDFCYDQPFESIGRVYDKTLVLKGYSKTYAMTGWRMGYAAAGPKLHELIEAMTKIQQYSFVCAPTPFQKATLTTFDCDMSGYIAGYRKKRDMIFNGLKDRFGLVKPGGAFYAFVPVPKGKGNGSEFVKKAIENNVLVIPGNVFSEKDTHFRISYATTDDKIAQGVEILNRLAGA